MSQYYRIELVAPATLTTPQVNFQWTPNSGIVESAEVELHKSTGGRISNLEVMLWDKNWNLANQIPDPAFRQIQMRLFLSRAGEGMNQSRLVFDGFLTSMRAEFPAPENLALVAHDKTLLARKQALARTFQNKTSIQILQIISSVYGYSLDTSLVQPTDVSQRVIDMGMSGAGKTFFSDWDHVRRALAVDGLEIVVNSKGVLQVRKGAQLTYPTTFRRGDANTISFQVTINHVQGPGQGGQVKVPVPGGNKGTLAGAQGTPAVESTAAGADAVTQRTTPQGAKTGQGGAHTESTGDYSKLGVKIRRRKDEAQLIVRCTPDIGLEHLINMSGYGAKFDGLWRIESIKHPVTGFGASTTHLRLNREPSSASDKGLGVASVGINL